MLNKFKSSFRILEPMPENRFIGIDFSSKRAGTTAIAFVDEGELHVLQSIKGEDADKFIRNYVQAYKANFVFIDAPLSLPQGLNDPESLEVFYRAADRKLQAMSPMFLGGLTSRAMLLKKTLELEKHKVFEVYPKALVEELQLKEHYKHDLLLFQKELQQLTPPLPELRNWHQADAVLAWLSGSRFMQGDASVYGDETEGVIYV